VGLACGGVPLGTLWQLCCAPAGLVLLALSPVAIPPFF